jgi:hypothetical protein
MGKVMPNLKSKVEEVLGSLVIGRTYLEGGNSVFRKASVQEALSALHATLKESMLMPKDLAQAATNQMYFEMQGYNSALSEVNEVLNELSRQSEKEI